MDSRYMVTHSLLSSWGYAMKDNPFEDATSEGDPMADFMKTLRREPIPTNEAMQNGIDFENMVTDILAGVNPNHPWTDAARAVATQIQGAKLQFKASKVVRIGNLDVLLYGRLDALKAGTIFDVKYTSNYDVGKYIDSTQHPMYFEIIPRATDFVYLASNGSQVWPERYRREESPDILVTVHQFFDWLNMTGLMDVYLRHWEAR